MDYLKSQAELKNLQHELRTPLCGILGVAELLSQQPLSSLQKEQVHIIHESCLRLIDFINCFFCPNIIERDNNTLGSLHGGNQHTT